MNLKISLAAWGLLGSLILNSAPAQSVSENLASNGNFESDAKGAGWPDDWGHPKTGGTYEVENGNHFLRLRAEQTDQMTMLYREIRLPKDAKALELKFRARVSELKVGKSPWFDARIMMNFADDARQKVSPAPPAPKFSKSTEGWVEKSVKFPVPEGATMLQLMPTLFRVESGTFDLDDLSVSVTDAGEVKAASDAAAAQKAAKVAKAKQDEVTATVSAEGSLLANGSFEADTKGAGWPDKWARAKEGITYEAEEGNHFLRLHSTEPGKTTMYYREIRIPSGVKAMELSFRGRVSNLKLGSLPWFDARIILNLRDASKKKVSPEPKPPYFTKDTTGWVERSTKFLVPEGATTLVMMPALFNVQSGTFDIDDIELKPTDPAPILVAAQAEAEAIKKAYVAPEAPNPSKWPQELHVEGAKVLTTGGKEIWLQGLNTSGLETVLNDRQIMKSALVGVEQWKANIVRLPVRGEYWLGNSPTQKDGGKAYRDLVDNVVNLVANRGAYLLLDLHRFRAPVQADVDFWKDAAAHYKNHPAVLFDLFNEPHDLSWEIWKNGGFVAEKKQGVDESAFLAEEDKKKANAGFQSVGMKALLDAVRSTGAKNVVVVGGLAWAGDLSGITKGYALEDKSGNGIIYGWHNYNWHKDWQHRVVDAIGKYPILVGEVGADTKKMNFIPLADQEDPYTWVPDMLGFIQKYKLHWTAWCLHPRATPVLISDWDYTPTPFWGVFAKDALAGKQFEMKRMR